ncbi:MAG: RsiV family protein [Clostridiales bacterium]|nr:RsiV family protein [Clostridiales bacterium]
MKKALALVLVFGLVFTAQSALSGVYGQTDSSLSSITPVTENTNILDDNGLITATDNGTVSGVIENTNPDTTEAPSVSEGLITRPNIVSSITELDNIKIQGELPQIENLVNTGFTNRINQKIQESYLSLNRSGYKNINASYEVYNWGNITSLVVKYDISQTPGQAGKQVVRTFVFDKLSNTEITLRNLVGRDYMGFINNYISSEIAKTPNTYFTGANTFSSIKSTQSFYVSSGKIYVIFDEYSIGPVSAGTPVFEIPYDNTITLNLSSKEYLLNDTEKRFIPLSTVLRLGMDLRLNQGGTMDVLDPNGRLITTVNVNNKNINSSEMLYIDGYDVGISKEFAASELGITVEDMDGTDDVRVSYTFE